MRDFTVTPMEKQRYDGHIDFPTQHKLALQARQSSKEQRLHNMESYESQTTVLLEHALDMGWQGMEVDIIPFLENKGKGGKIVDASGTRRIDQRPTMQDLWYHIEHDLVKAVMTRGVDRLFRHVNMVEPAQFANLCAEHHCLVITIKEVRHRTKIVVYDFTNPEDRWDFLDEARLAAEYIVNQIDWMNRCRLNKGMRGEYDGRLVPSGYLLDKDREHYVEYRPHSEVVKWLFRRYRELCGNFAALCREIDQRITDQGYLFPPLPGDEKGRTITIPGLKRLLTNTHYIGWWTVYETINRGTDDEYKVLRAKIEDHHPAIVDAVDFWYAHDRVTDQDTPRSRYSKVGTIPAAALLEGIATAAKGQAVYVYQNAQEPDSAVYVIVDTKDALVYRVQHGSIAVQELDHLFTEHLLEKLEAGKKLADQFVGSEWEHDVDGIEYAMAQRLMELTKVQDVSTAGIDAQIAGYREEADSLDRTLRYGSAKLSPEKIEEYSERLHNLEITIAQLTAQKNRANKTKEQLAKFAEKLLDVPTTWKEMELENKQRFVQLVTEKITLTRPAPNWLALRVRWLWPDEPDSVLYIWQRQGLGEAWTDEEDGIMCRLYPQADRASILSALPRRSWKAIVEHARDLHTPHGIPLSRAYQFNNSQLHKALCVNDAEFMAQVGLEFSPDARAWWIVARETSESSSRVWSSSQFALVPRAGTICPS
jgi:hypothetical protein